MRLRLGTPALACLLSSPLLVFALPACTDEDCREISYAQKPAEILSCASTQIRVRATPCFGMPDACSFAVSDGQLSFTVKKQDCSSGEAQSTGCSSRPDEFDCTGPALEPGTYAAAGEGPGSTALSIVVKDDGTCALAP